MASLTIADSAGYSFISYDLKVSIISQAHLRPKGVLDELAWEFKGGDQGSTLSNESFSRARLIVFKILACRGKLLKDGGWRCGAHDAGFKLG